MTTQDLNANRIAATFIATKGIGARKEFLSALMANPAEEFLSPALIIALVRLSVFESVIGIFARNVIEHIVRIHPQFGPIAMKEAQRITSSKEAQQTQYLSQAYLTINTLLKLDANLADETLVNTVTEVLQQPGLNSVYADTVNTTLTFLLRNTPGLFDKDRIINLARASVVEVKNDFAANGLKLICDIYPQHRPAIYKAFAESAFADDYFVSDIGKRGLRKLAKIWPKFVNKTLLSRLLTSKRLSDSSTFVALAEKAPDQLDENLARKFTKVILAEGTHVHSWNDLSRISHIRHDLSLAILQVIKAELTQAVLAGKNLNRSYQDCFDAVTFHDQKVVDSQFAQDMARLLLALRKQPGERQTKFEWLHDFYNKLIIAQPDVFKEAFHIFAEAIKADPRIGRAYYNHAIAIMEHNPELADDAFEMIKARYAESTYGFQRYCDDLAIIINAKPQLAGQIVPMLNTTFDEDIKSSQYYDTKGPLKAMAALLDKAPDVITSELAVSFVYCYCHNRDGQVNLLGLLLAKRPDLAETVYNAVGASDLGHHRIFAMRAMPLIAKVDPNLIGTARDFAAAGMRSDYTKHEAAKAVAEIVEMQPHKTNEFIIQDAVDMVLHSDADSVLLGTRILNIMTEANPEIRQDIWDRFQSHIVTGNSYEQAKAYNFMCGMLEDYDELVTEPNIAKLADAASGSDIDDHRSAFNRAMRAATGVNPALVESLDPNQPLNTISAGIRASAALVCG